MFKFSLGRTAPTLILALSGLLLAADLAVTQDASSILSEAKKQYEAFMEKAKDLKTVSVMTIGTGDGAMTNTMTAYYKGEKSRIESKMVMPETEGGSMSVGPTETVVLNDGANTWMASSFTPAKKLMPSEAGDYYTEQQWWEAIPDSARIVGDEQYGGKDCEVVEIKAGKGAAPVKLWIDKSALVIVGGDGTFQGKRMRWVNSDFRQVEDREIPYKVDFYSGDKLVATLTLQSIETNTGLSDDLFDPKSLSKTQDIERMREQWNSGR
jgi:outer membrane lipoprotein-sorting protein